jgi:hypothetical protein
MGASTWSGPIKAGTVREGASPNVGTVALVQSAPYIQTAASAAATSIILPAGAHILDIQVTITTACDGASQNLSVGTSVTSTELFSALGLGTSADTIFFGSAGTVTDADVWENVGTSDVTIWVLTSAGTAGRGTISVTYTQGEAL